MMTKFFNKKSFFVVALTLVGCASIELNPGAENVQIVEKRPKGCKYLGDITGNQGNKFTGGFTSNADMETGARNDLKNKAAARGGNVVYLLTNRAQTTKSQGDAEQTSIVLSGSVFNCPAAVLDNL